MSHVTKVEMKIKNLEALERAFQDIGMEFMQGQTHFKSYGGETNEGKCQHAARIPGNDLAYEVGIARDVQEGGYKLLWDTWAGAGGLVDKVGGTEMASLRGRYSENLANSHWQKRGYRMTRSEDQEFVYVRARK